MIGTDVALAAYWLERGEPVAIPTETVYGLAANAYNPAAIAKVFAVKERPHSNPLIVHIGAMERLSELAAELPPSALLLARTFWPGPLTLLLPKTDRISSVVTAGSERVALRMPAHPLCLELLGRLPFPLVAPSANRYTRLSPTTARHVEAQLGERIPYILDGGACSVGIESTIVGFENELPVVYRLGAVTPGDIAGVLSVEPTLYDRRLHREQTAPGQALKHYSPRTPLMLTDDLDKTLQHCPLPQRVGCLSLAPVPLSVQPSLHLTLSPTGDTAQAASRLYDCLHQLDQLDLELILVQPLPPTDGIALALNDRLMRAANK